MSDPRDSMNLLPDSERQAGEAALKRAAAAKDSGEIKLIVPSMGQKEKIEEKKQSFFARWRDKKEKTKLEALKKRGETGTMPAMKPEVKMPVMPPAVKSEKPKAVEKPKVVETPKPAAAPKKKESAPLTMPLKIDEKVTEKKLPVQLVPEEKPVKEKKAESRAKLHEPVAAAEPSGPRVNLVPADIVAQSASKPWVLYASILVLTLAVWVLFSGIAIARAKRAESRVSEWNAKISQINTTIKNYDSGKVAALALQKQFSLVKEQVEGHLYWTPFLQKLEEVTIPDVYYTSMNVNSGGEVHLRAVAKTYDAAARQIRALERAPGFVKTVQVNQARQELQPGATLPVPIVAFDIQLNLQDGVLKLPAPQAAVENTQQ